MIKLKIGKESVNVPTAWDEVTLGQAIGLSAVNDNNIIQIISIITGLPYDICYRLRSGDVEAVLVPCLTFLNDSFDQSKIDATEPPKTFTINGKTFSKYYDPAAMIYAQHLNLQALIADEKKRDIDKIAGCIAICCQRPDSYNEDEQRRLENGAMHLPLYQAWSIAGFFLSQFKTFLKLQNFQKKISTVTSRRGQASKSLKSSAYLTQ